MTRTLVATLTLALFTATAAAVAAPPMGRVRVADDRRGFVVGPEAKPFVPWGVNYDRDENSRLLEDYWGREWAKVEEDFGEIKALGANVVRVHLQFGRFFREPDAPEPAALERLGKLLALAERLGLYLDITGLGSYRKKDAPAWYDALDEAGRWRAQAAFWRAVAGACKDSPAVFCYDLMNEPVVPGNPARKPGDWLGPPLGEFHYVQVVTLGQGDRTRPEIARKWVETMAKAVREVDRKAMVTVGLVDWSLDRPGLNSGFVPENVAGPLDFVAVHLYPGAGAKKLDEAMDVLKGFAKAGKPVVIEETFPLGCSAAELKRFFERSRAEGLAAGWIGFYWGKTAEDCRKSGTIPDAMTADWLDLFRQGPPGR